MLEGYNGAFGGLYISKLLQAHCHRSSHFLSSLGSPGVMSCTVIGQHGFTLFLK